MERNQGILMSNNFFQILLPIFFIGRVCGLCPITYRKKGSNVLLKWSVKYCVYSYILAALLASLTIYGIIHDLKMSKIKESIRMSNDKGKYITICDISIVIVIVLIIIFSLPFTFKRFLKTLDSFNKIDSIIPLKDFSADRKMSICLLTAAIVIYIYIASFDIYNWNKRSTANNQLLKDYGSFYILYFIIITQELYYCNLLLCIRRRYKSLNSVLYEHCNESSIVLKQMEKYLGAILVTGEKKSSCNNEAKLSNKEITKPEDDPNKELTANNIRDLARVHELICETIQNVNYCCGISILLVMVSCLLHLIVTPYFFLLEIHNGDNTQFAILQFSWIVVHLLRLLLIVEPCQACLYESQKTTALAFKILTHSSKKEIKPQLSIFVMQLTFRRVEFSSCGLVNISRSIVTTIAGAVTTYMIILFQFSQG